MRTKASNSNGMQLHDKNSRKLGRLQRSASTGIVASFLNRILATDHALSARTVRPQFASASRKAKSADHAGTSLCSAVCDNA
jgi:FixJ family two-component response regulator